MGLLSEMSEINRQIRDLNNKKAEIGKKIADFASPYKIGDVIEIRGYYHNGKKGRVISIGWNHNSGGLGVRVKVLKADGSDSKFYADWDADKDPLLGNAIQKLGEKELQEETADGREALVVRRYRRVDGENGVRIYAIATNLSGAEFSIDLTETRYAQVYDYPLLYEADLQEALDKGDLDDFIELLDPIDNPEEQ